MLKRSLIVLAVVALLGVSAQAGSLKVHDWPCTFSSLEITTIPVLMDIGYYVTIKDQDKLKIKLVQDTSDLKKYTGCVTMKVSSNFEVKISASISGNGTVGGDYSVSVSPDVVLAGASEAPVEVCATLKKADLLDVIGPQDDVQVATVTIKVKPNM